MRHRTKALAAFALALALAVVPLAACSGEPDSGGDVAPDAGGQSAPIDVSTLSTFGDVLAIDSENYTASWDENHYLYAVDSGGSVIRAVVEINPEIYQQISEIEFQNDDSRDKLIELIGDLPMASVEDIASQRLSQEELDAFVGKTGQDLYDAGFTFLYYSLYGGKQTMAWISNGYFAYEFTFDVTVPESESEDEGASLVDAPVTEVAYVDIAQAAVDPSLVG